MNDESGFTIDAGTGDTGPGPSVPTSDPFFAPAKLVDPEPHRIGNYRILRTIGQGGMGVVYLGRRSDDSGEKLVAIKVAQTARTAEAGKRLERERRVLFALNHPNIARIFDGGTLEDGRPYFVMEYIEGRTIDEYCDLNRLNTRERIELFQKVCDAVTYCHKHLIVHRDIKPANILVDRDGEPRLLDFGIAKLLNPDLLQAGEATVDVRGPMTVAYASPEQVSGGLITPASDIYSLGVLLYRLLTGRLPYQLPDRWRQEVVDIICNESPELPSTAVRKTTTVPDRETGTSMTVTPERVAELRSEDPGRLRRHLAGDLDDILLVALAKKPTLRYDTAGDLRRDLENHIEDRAVEARKRTKRVNWRYYAFQRFAKRHRVAIAAGTAATIALIAGLGLALYQRGIAIEQRDRAERVAADLQDLSGGVVDTFADVAARLPAGRIAQERLFEDAAQILTEAVERDDLTDDARATIATRLTKLARLASGVRGAGTSDFETAGALLDRAEAVLADAGEPPQVVTAGIELVRADILRASGENYKAIEAFESLVQRSSVSDGSSEAEVTLAVETRTGLANSLYLANPDENVIRATEVAAEAHDIASRAHRDINQRWTADLLAVASQTAAEITQTAAERDKAAADPRTARWLSEALELRTDLASDAPWDAEVRGELLASLIWSLDRTSQSAKDGVPIDMERAVQQLESAWTHVEFLLEADGQDNEAVRRLGALIKTESDLRKVGALPEAVVSASLAEAGGQSSKLTRLLELSDRYRDALADLRDRDNSSILRIAIEIETRVVNVAHQAAEFAPAGSDERIELKTLAAQRALACLLLTRQYLTSGGPDATATLRANFEATVYPVLGASLPIIGDFIQNESTRSNEGIATPMVSLRRQWVHIGQACVDAEVEPVDFRAFIEQMIPRVRINEG